MRLIEIGEAVKAISSDLLDTDPSIPWSAVARVRDHLAHRYFDTDVPRPTAHAAIDALVECGDLIEVTGRECHRVYEAPRIFEAVYGAVDIEDP